MLQQTNVIAVPADLSHGNVVQAIRTVEDNTLHSNRLGQVFGRLRLPGASRALRGAVQVEMEGTDQRAIATIGKRGDDQPTGVTQVFVAVVDCGISDANQHFCILPVITHLCQPVEVILGGHACN